MGMRNTLGPSPPTATLPSDKNVESVKELEEEFSSLRILDATSSTWLGRWNSFFKGLDIKYLRSPMWFHPAPGEVDALVTYANRMEREDELLEIKGVVGKELSKHQRKKGYGALLLLNGSDKSSIELNLSSAD